MGECDPGDELMILLDDMLIVGVIGKVADTEVKAFKKSAKT